MKALVMAAGKGTRMLPLTKDMPKPMIEVAGKPFLSYVLDTLMSAGISEIAIIVGYKSKKIKEFIEWSRYSSVKLIYQPEPLGTGHAISIARDFIGQSQFVALGGDNLWSERDIRAVAQDDDFCYICASESENPSKFGVLEVNNGLLLRIHEKPEHPPSNLVNTGLYKFTPEIFSFLDNISPSPRGELELTDAISELAKENKVRVVQVQDYWLDLGCIDDIKQVSRFLEKRKDFKEGDKPLGR